MQKENVSLSIAQISSCNQHIVVVVKWFIGFSLASSSDLFQKWKPMSVYYVFIYVLFLWKKTLFRLCPLC